MYYLLIYLWIPAVAVLMDLLVSYVLLNRLSVYGKAAPRPFEGAPDEGTERLYVILLQNDEGRDVKAFKRPIQIRLMSRNGVPLSLGPTLVHTDGGARVRGGEEHHQGLFELSIQRGPGDHVTADWNDDHQDCVIVRIRRLRPWKTYVLTCRVRNQVHGLHVELRVPKRSPLQHLLQRINKHAFEWSTTYHKVDFDVANQPVGRSIKRGARGLVYVGLPLIVLCSAFYFAFCKTAWVEYASLYGVSGSWSPTSILRIPYLWVDLLVFAAGFAVTWALARSPSVPPAPGYQDERILLCEKPPELTPSPHPLRAPNPAKGEPPQPPPSRHPPMDGEPVEHRMTDNKVIRVVILGEESIRVPINVPPPEKEPSEL